jgi:hypothetical protein
VCRIDNQRKEVFVVHKDSMRAFDLTRDTGETNNLASLGTTISDELSSWLEEVRSSLEKTDVQPPPLLDEETYDRLEALGYTR